MPIYKQQKDQHETMDNLGKLKLIVGVVILVSCLSLLEWSHFSLLFYLYMISVHVSGSAGTKNTHKTKFFGRFLASKMVVSSPKTLVVCLESFAKVVNHIGI